MENKLNEMMDEYNQFGQGLGRFIIMILIILIMLIILFVRCSTYCDENKMYMKLDSLLMIRAGDLFSITLEMKESMDSLKNKQDNMMQIIKNRQSDTVYVMIDSIDEQKYITLSTILINLDGEIKKLSGDNKLYNKQLQAKLDSAIMITKICYLDLFPRIMYTVNNTDTIKRRPVNIDSLFINLQIITGNYIIRGGELDPDSLMNILKQHIVK